MKPLWKTVWQFLKILKVELSYDLAIPLLGIHPRGIESRISKRFCTLMFIATLFTIAKK